jgi:acetolactate synthase-1/3 small subunit
VDAKKKNRPEIMVLVEVFRAKIVDITPRTFTIEVTGNGEKVRSFIELMKPFGIREIVRTGSVAISRG